MRHVPTALSLYFFSGDAFEFSNNGGFSFLPNIIFSLLSSAIAVPSINNLRWKTHVLFCNGIFSPPKYNLPFECLEIPILKKNII